MHIEPFVPRTSYICQIFVKDYIHCNSLNFFNKYYHENENSESRSLPYSFYGSWIIESVVG